MNGEPCRREIELALFRCTKTPQEDSDLQHTVARIMHILAKHEAYVASCDATLARIRE